LAPKNNQSFFACPFSTHTHVYSFTFSNGAKYSNNKNATIKVKNQIHIGIKKIYLLNILAIIPHTIAPIILTIIDNAKFT